MRSTAVQAQLQERARQFADRQQQTGQAHQGLLSRSATPVMDRIFSGLGGLSRTSSRAGTPMAQPIPQTAQTFIIGSDVEDVEDEGMMTAPEEDMIYNSLRSANPSATHIQLRQTSLVLDKYRNRTPMQMAINFKNITEVYRALVQNEFIEPLNFEAIQQRINVLQVPVINKQKTN